MTEERYEPVIGLEVHCELRTATKLWCACPNEFGGEPNTHICPICLGLPGTLPVLNRNAVEYAMRIGTALNCEIKPSKFHRKNYFYPDMPKDFQISQYDEPINVQGYLDLPTGIRIGIERAHIEEDTGKSSHLGKSGRIHAAYGALVDYNRAGVPLVEIVSAPDIRSSEQAKDYVSELRAVLVATGATDGRMEEGSLRVDANVSVRKGPDAPFGTRCEIKNVNSLRSLVRAIEYEIKRQIEVLEDGGRIIQQTRHFNEDTLSTVALRSKEEAQDYRYFPEPDLPPISPGEAWINKVKEELPPLPPQRRAKVKEIFGTGDDGQIITLVEQDLDGLFLGVLSHGADGEIAIRRLLNEAASQIEAARKLDVKDFAALIGMEKSGKLSATQCKAVLAEMLESGGSPLQIAASLGFEGMKSNELEEVITQIINDNPDAFERFKAGDEKVTQFFVGQVMKATKGKANGKSVIEFLETKKS
ncbi:MAG: Asp-tRNA(Asn)/Glu-tRNA(Gln) amidotransferase subunit GatB [Acidimicrobiales bacterium]|nr:Asp-tRNA(Asn)/Glu-tRNA(Gln) amidotransferase subunit GatB [Acidimicrobiales bacterium]